jgi:hypothetical protein
VPPATPLQVQLKVLLLFVGVVLTPVLHAAEPLGANATFVPFAEPQAPLVGLRGAEQAVAEVLVPPLIPLQPHVTEVVPAVMPATVPALHAAVPLGAAVTGVVPLALPHAPATICGAEQLVVPPFPAHVQFQVLLALPTELGVPVVQRALGVVAEAIPFAVPHTPGVGTGLKVAATVRTLVMPTVQMALPLQSPPQFENTKPGSAVAVRETVAPGE